MSEESLSWFLGDSDAKEAGISATVRPDHASVRKTLEKIAPVLFFRVKSEVDNSHFWKAAESAVFSLTGHEADTKNHFSDFIQILFRFRSVFCPKEVPDYVRFIESSAVSPLSTFFLCKLAGFLNDPSLLIRIMSHMKFTAHPLFAKLQTEKGAKEHFFDLFMSFLSFPLSAHTKEFWDVRLMLCDILVSFITKNAESIVLIDCQISYLHQKLLKLITDCDPYTSIPFIRLLIIFHRATLPSIKPEYASRRLMNLLNAAPSGFPAHAMVARFVFKECVKYIDYKKTFSLVANQGFSGTWDVQFCSLISASQEHENSLQAIRILARVMCLSFVYSRISGYVLCKILERTRFSAEVQEWVTEFLSELQIALALQNRKNKYVNRRERITELLNSDLFRKIAYVNNFLEATDTTSASFLLVVEQYEEAQVSIKFAPFNKKGVKLFGQLGTKLAKKKKGKTSKRADSVPPKIKGGAGKNKQAASDNEDDSIVSLPKKKKRTQKKKIPNSRPK